MKVATRQYNKKFRILLLLILTELFCNSIQQWRTVPLAENLGLEGVAFWVATTKDPVNEPYGGTLCGMQVA